MRLSVRIALPVVAGLLLALSGIAVAQSKQESTVKKAPVQTTSPASGKEMFKSYCAACHGPDGKGNGPAAAELKQKPADLTTLAKRHDGKFPDDYVASVLRFGVKSPTHGSSDMPIWGPLLSAVSNRDRQQTEMRINNLTSYLRSIQVK